MEPLSSDGACGDGASKPQPDSSGTNEPAVSSDDCDDAAKQPASIKSGESEQDPASSGASSGGNAKEPEASSGKLGFALRRTQRSAPAVGKAALPEAAKAEAAPAALFGVVLRRTKVVHKPPVIFGTVIEPAAPPVVEPVADATEPVHEALPTLTCTQAALRLQKCIRRRACRRAADERARLRCESSSGEAAAAETTMAALAAARS